MSIKVYTKVPSELLAAIKRQIATGEIKTWSCDADGDFTHTPDQWKNKAWLRPAIVLQELRFALIPRKDVPVTKVISGIYHGRFTEMLCTHFGEVFTKIDATIP